MPSDSNEGITVDKSTIRPSCFETIFCAITRISPSHISKEFEINLEISSKGSISFSMYIGIICN